jgi:Transcriptional regulator, AbiEi antitoxin, Type IV TA system/Transcriptional regulator, AbiEi antitoxin N-terminal domain
MAKRIRGKLNQLEYALPEGLLVDGAWLTKHGYSRSLQTQYVGAGWLEQPARGVYRRPRGTLSWQQAVISLQTIIGPKPLVVGGRTALELQGFAHYLSQNLREVHLYGPKAPPGWLSKLPLNVRFVFHNSRALFASEAPNRVAVDPAWNSAKGEVLNGLNLGDGFVAQPWGQWDWPMTMSSPERALLELLNELPARESFHQVDKLFEGLTNLSPRRLMTSLTDCRSVKVKRLFFFYAARHAHAWVKRLDREKVDLGSGKRMLVKGGRLDLATQITVPEDLDGVR